MPKSIYFKNLDGLRAIAALSVVLFHITLWFDSPNNSFYPVLKSVISFNDHGGKLGVVFFFVLSGFLITYLLFEEFLKKGKISIFNFYVRRVLRIWPLYYFTLLAGFFLFPYLYSFFDKEYVNNANLFLYSIFATNFDHIYNSGPGSGVLGVQWSVAVEEQFYLIWPLMFVAFKRKFIFPFVLIVLFLLSEYFNFKNNSWSASYYHLFSNFRYLTFGALLAYFCFYYQGVVKKILNKIPRLFYVLFYGFSLLSLFFADSLNKISVLFHYFNHFLPFLFFGFVIVEQNFSDNSFFKIGKYNVLTWLGQISYGLYLTHMIAIYLLLLVFPSTEDYFFLKLTLSVAITVFISHFSYKYFESYFLSFKKKFSRE